MKNKLRIKVQKANLSNIDEITRIANALWKFDGGLDSHYSISKDFERKFKTSLRRNMGRRDFITLKAVCGSEIAGIISGEIQHKVSYRKLKKVGYIQELFVAERYRNKGIATMLIAELLRWFKRKGVRHAEVIAVSRNKGANDFYTKLGFREIHRKYMLLLR
jgi:GNAT superfamily N-acetyltransferase